MRDFILPIIISLISGVGIGTIIGALVTTRFAKRKLLFEHKLDKYSLLIDALQNAVINSAKEQKQKAVSAGFQVILIAPGDIENKVKQLFRNPDFINIRNDLIRLMKNDLQIK